MHCFNVTSPLMQSLYQVGLSRRRPCGYFPILRPGNYLLRSASTFTYAFLFLCSQDPEIIQKLEELNVIKHLSELVGRGAFDIRKGAAYCIMNIANHGPEHLDKLSHKQLLPAFLDLVKSQDADMIRLGLGYIELLLTQSPRGKEIIDNVPDCMEALAAVAPAPDPELFAFANKLVDQYFGESPEMQE